MKPLQYEKALLPIYSTDSGNDIDCRFLHEEKALLPIDVTSPSIVIELSWEQLENKDSEIEIYPQGLENCKTLIQEQLKTGGRVHVVHRKRNNSYWFYFKVWFLSIYIPILYNKISINRDQNTFKEKCKNEWNWYIDFLLFSKNSIEWSAYAFLFI